MRTSTAAKTKPAKEQEYMSASQLAHFRERLLDMKKNALETIHHQQLSDSESSADPVDRSSLEDDRAKEALGRQRAFVLLKDIEAALKRMQEGEYGFCEETGEPIGIDRLNANPVARLCLEAQEEKELRDRQRH